MAPRPGPGGKENGPQGMIWREHGVRGESGAEGLDRPWDIAIFVVTGANSSHGS